MRGTALNANCCRLRIPLRHCTPQREIHTHAHMAKQRIPLDGTDGVSPGAPNAKGEGGDPVGEVAAIIVPRTTLRKHATPKRCSTA